jgi:hypothetical protein
MSIPVDFPFDKTIIKIAKENLEFTDFKSISNKEINLRPVNVTYVTPLKNPYLLSDKWDTVADFTKTSINGVEPNEILKHL